MSFIAFDLSEPDSDALSEPIALFGANMKTLTAIPWMIASDAATAKAKSLVKCGKAFVNTLLDDFAYLWNYVDENNSSAIAWLKQIGFTVVDEPGCSPEGFKYFYATSETIQCDDTVSIAIEVSHV